jgi:nicotinamidase/pyrazinamidase
VGVVTNICVLHTAIDAALRGYELIVPEDCVAALSDYEQDYGVWHIKSVLKGTITRSGFL